MRKGQSSGFTSYLPHLCGLNKPQAARHRGIHGFHPWQTPRVSSNGSAGGISGTARKAVEMTKTITWEQIGNFSELSKARESVAITCVCQRLKDRKENEKALYLKNKSSRYALIGHYWSGEAKDRHTRGQTSYGTGLEADLPVSGSELEVEQAQKIGNWQSLTWSSSDLSGQFLQRLWFGSPGWIPQQAWARVLLSFVV